MITVIHNKNLVLKTNAPFISCISNINNTLFDNAENADVVMLMSMIEYNKNYSSLWNYYRDKPTNPLDGNYNADPKTNSQPFR